MDKKVFLAVDLGAGSGRIMAAVFDGAKVSLEEVSRWGSEPVKIGGSFHWEVNGIFDNIVAGLRKAKSVYGGAIVSLGIDTWGVDYGLLDKSDKLLNLPYIYRDSRTDNMMESVFAKVPNSIYVLQHDFPDSLGSREVGEHRAGAVVFDDARPARVYAHWGEGE